MSLFTCSKKRRRSAGRKCKVLMFCCATWKVNYSQCCCRHQGEVPRPAACGTGLAHVLAACSRGSVFSGPALLYPESVVELWLSCGSAAPHTPQYLGSQCREHLLQAPLGPGAGPRELSLGPWPWIRAAHSGCLAPVAGTMSAVGGRDVWRQGSSPDHDVTCVPEPACHQGGSSSQGVRVPSTLPRALPSCGPAACAPAPPCPAGCSLLLSTFPGKQGNEKSPRHLFPALQAAVGHQVAVFIVTA